MSDVAESNAWQETAEETTLTPAQRIEAVAAEFTLSVAWTFVPFSESRNKAEKSPSLNWRFVLLQARGVSRNPPPFEVLRGDYSQGCAHAPSYKQRQTEDVVTAVANECETGKRTRVSPSGTVYSNGAIPPPAIHELLWSLSHDAGAIDYPTFEDWAGNYGYDADSRKGEAIYRACLETGLKLRAALGDAGLAKLREAGQDY